MLLTLHVIRTGAFYRGTYHNKGKKPFSSNLGNAETMRKHVAKAKERNPKVVVTYA